MKLVHRIVGAAVICVTASAGQAFAERNDARIPAPANVSAIPGSGKVRITWSAVDGAEGYRVYRATNGVWDKRPVGRTSGTTHISTSLVNGTTYSFTVAAYTKDGDGTLSLTVIAVPVATPQELTSTPSDRRVVLKWEPSEGATSYTVYRKVSADSSFVEVATGVTAPEFVDLNLSNGTRYQYQVRAMNAGAESDLSEKVSAVPFSATGDDITAVSLTPRALPDSYTFCDARAANTRPNVVLRLFSKLKPF
jgi:hypothetical protein